jgi:hypothetical protein
MQEWLYGSVPAALVIYFALNPDQVKMLVAQIMLYMH